MIYYTLIINFQISNIFSTQEITPSDENCMFHALFDQISRAVWSTLQFTFHFDLWLLVVLYLIELIEKEKTFYGAGIRLDWLVWSTMRIEFAFKYFEIYEELCELW